MLRTIGPFNKSDSREIADEVLDNEAFEIFQQFLRGEIEADEMTHQLMVVFDNAAARRGQGAA